jgi:predicted transposase YdaD
LALIAAKAYAIFRLLFLTKLSSAAPGLYMDKVNNPHDKMIRETLSRKETAMDFFTNYLPENILAHMDMKSLEMTKDSFIEEDLADYYSDILYKVRLKDKPGFLYLLFEHNI